MHTARALVLASLVLQAVAIPSTPMDLRPTFDEILLNQWPMVLSHDAATGYLGGGPVNAWTKTQSTGLGGQLSCGSRSFDLRPKVDGSHLYMHHGAITVKKEVSEALAEVVEWASKNTTELVVVYIVDCDGTDCDDLTKAALKANGIPHITDCSKLKGMTVSDALKTGALPTGGSVLAIFGCVEEHYDSSIQCYGKASSSEDEVYCCYGDHKDIPLDAFDKYMNKTATTGPPSDGKLWMMQAHWQESVDSVELGVLHFSSLLDDETRSNTISRVIDQIHAGRFPIVNLFEVNDVCDNGNALLTALRSQLHNY